MPMFYSTDNAEIDHQHALLAGLLDRLESICKEKKGHGVACACCPSQFLQSCRDEHSRLIGELSAFLVGHVTYEEGLMQLLPDLPHCHEHVKRHKRHHQAASELLAKLAVQLDEDNPRLVGMQIRQLFSEWSCTSMQGYDDSLLPKPGDLPLAEVELDRALVILLDLHVFRNRPSSETMFNPLPGMPELSSFEKISRCFESLTPRQREVCLLMSDGVMNKVIAKTLDTSVNTIKTHRAEIFRKMEVASLVELVRRLDMLRKPALSQSHTDTLPVRQSSVSPVTASSSFRVVVVEDNDALRMTIVSALRTLGHQAQGVRNGDELAREISATPPDIVLLDIGLGANCEDGFAIAARLRRNLDCGIVVLTARSELDARIRGLEEGADAYLVKPVDFSELSAVMRSVMRRLRVTG